MADDSSNVDGQSEATLEIDLKDQRLAAFLAWLVPGLGHIYQRRTGKGILFFVCIFGTFVFGLWIGQGRVVYASGVSPLSRQFFERWHYVCQLGVGLPALPALVQAVRVQKGLEPLFDDDAYVMRPPYMSARNGPFTSPDDAGSIVHHPDELSKWHYDLGDKFEMGTVFTVIAGLLNILAIYDAHGGPLIIPPRDDKKKTDKEQT